jgi:serine/threonine protein phosphatase PrpC
MMRRLRRVRGLLPTGLQPKLPANEPSSLSATRPPGRADDLDSAQLMDYAFCSQTHTGLRRANNEDAVFVDEARGIGILADGMGGYNAGEVASGMATSVVQADLQRWLDQDPAALNARDMRRALDTAVRNANVAVLAASQAHPEYAGMGTTIVAAVFQDDRLCVAHIGDSRCYRLRQGQLTQITKDHSLLQEQLDAGLITPEQAAFSTHRNLVTRALGIDEGVEVEIGEFTVAAGDLYLLCSDGLSDMVDDGVITDILLRPGSIANQATALVNAANDHGGRDNITVLLVHAIAGVRKKGLMDKLLRT